MSALNAAPDFFQEEGDDASRDQVRWLFREIGLDDAFFARLLRIGDREFRQWRVGEAALDPPHNKTLQDFWRTIRHLLSFLNLEQSRLKTLFETPFPVRRGQGEPIMPPWAGFTLRDFLAEHGAEAIKAVESWVTMLRFGNPYAA